VYRDADAIHLDKKLLLQLTNPEEHKVSILFVGHIVSYKGAV